MNFTGRRGPEKSFENAWQVLLGYTDPLILKPNAHVLMFFERNAQFGARRRVLDRIVEKNQKQLSQERSVAAEEDISFEIALNFDVLLVCQRRASMELTTQTVA